MRAFTSCLILLSFYSSSSLNSQPIVIRGTSEYLLTENDKTVLNSFLESMKINPSMYDLRLDSLLKSTARDPLKRAVIDSSFKSNLIARNNIIQILIDTFDLLIPTTVPPADIDEVEPIYPILWKIANTPALQDCLWGQILLSSKFKKCSYFQTTSKPGRIELKLKLIAIIFASRVSELEEVIELSCNTCFNDNVRQILERIDLINK